MRGHSIQQAYDPQLSCVTILIDRVLITNCHSSQFQSTSCGPPIVMREDPNRQEVDYQLSYVAIPFGKLLTTNRHARSLKSTSLPPSMVMRDIPNRQKFTTNRHSSHFRLANCCPPIVMRGHSNQQAYHPQWSCVTFLIDRVLITNCRTPQSQSTGFWLPIVICGNLNRQIFRMHHVRTVR